MNLPGGESINHDDDREPKGTQIDGDLFVFLGGEDSCEFDKHNVGAIEVLLLVFLVMSCVHKEFFVYTLVYTYMFIYIFIDIYIYL